MPDRAGQKTHYQTGDIERARSTIGPVPEAWPQPVLVMLSGLPGTGKSYLARKLVERLPMAVVSSDAVRMALVRQPKYTWAESRRVHDVCHFLIDELLAKKVPVIFDATNLIERYRHVVFEIAKRNNAKLVVVEVVSPPDVIRERMSRRALGEDALDRSEADWAVYMRMRGSAEPIRYEHLSVDTSQDLHANLSRIVEAIQN